MVVRAVVYNSYGAVCLRQRTPRISEYAEHAEENRTEFNSRSGKSEAEVRLIIEDCARRIVGYY